MTETEALNAMKLECLWLQEIFTDDQLLYFLNKYKVTNEDLTVTYNIRKSIYSALTSAVTTEQQQLSRGTVTATKVDLLKIRRMYATIENVSLTKGDYYEI